jgi:hypothetical protein
MATHSKIGRLSVRIETLVARRGQPLRVEDLNESGTAVLERRYAELRSRTSADMPVNDQRYAFWTDDQILRRLIALGTLEASHFKTGTTV